MQAKAPETKPFGNEACAPSDRTVVRWLGNAGALINSRGTTIMIDPVLSGFDMPLLIKVPIVVKGLLINPERVVVLASGEEYCLNNR